MARRPLTNDWRPFSSKPQSSGIHSSYGRASIISFGTTAGSGSTSHWANYKGRGQASSRVLSLQPVYLVITLVGWTLGSSPRNSLDSGQNSSDQSIWSSFFWSIYRHLITIGWDRFISPSIHPLDAGKFNKVVFQSLSMYPSTGKPPSSACCFSLAMHFTCPCPSRIFLIMESLLKTTFRHHIHWYELYKGGFRSPLALGISILSIPRYLEHESGSCMVLYFSSLLPARLSPKWLGPRLVGPNPLLDVYSSSYSGRIKLTNLLATCKGKGRTCNK